MVFCAGVGGAVCFCLFLVAFVLVVVVVVAVVTAHWVIHNNSESIDRYFFGYISSSSLTVDNQFHQYQPHTIFASWKIFLQFLSLVCVGTFFFGFQGFLLYHWEAGGNTTDPTEKSRFCYIGFEMVLWRCTSFPINCTTVHSLGTIFPVDNGYHSGIKMQHNLPIFIFNCSSTRTLRVSSAILNP